MADNPRSGTFTSDDAEIAYLDAGEGPPVVLVHGFASTTEANWVVPGWFDTLTRAGRRAIALDNRGHGASTKLYDPEDYHTDLMAQDVLALIDHLGLGRVDAFGYSMGARICAFLTAHHPDEVRSLILGGLGIKLIDGVGLSDDIALALEAPLLDDVDDPVGHQFRAFAEQTGSDLAALAACLRGSRQTLSREEARAIRLPVLIGVGTRDEVAGPAAPLAAIIPGAKVLDIVGRDHMLAVGDRIFKSGVLDFLRERP
jgi:pimeloyl-ACP methyl ester carboxylesterase